jgi:hypothetical protein
MLRNRARSLAAIGDRSRGLCERNVIVSRGADTGKAGSLLLESLNVGAAAGS